MEDQLVRIEDIPEESLPHFLRLGYRATPPSELAEYINRVCVMYNRHQVHPRYMTLMCRFNAESSEFGKSSHLFLNFTVKSMKEMGLNLGEFLSAPEVKEYELYDIGVTHSEQSTRQYMHSEHYDEHSVTVWFRSKGDDE